MNHGMFHELDQAGRCLNSEHYQIGVYVHFPSVTSPFQNYSLKQTLSSPVEQLDASLKGTLAVVLKYMHASIPYS